MQQTPYPHKSATRIISAPVPKNQLPCPPHNLFFSLSLAQTHTKHTNLLIGAFYAFTLPTSTHPPSIKLTVFLITFRYFQPLTLCRPLSRKEGIELSIKAPSDEKMHTLPSKSPTTIIPLSIPQNRHLYLGAFKHRNSILQPTLPA